MVVGDEHAEKEDGETVEDEDSVEGELDCAGDRFPRILGLTDSYTHKLGTEVGEGSGDEGGPDGEEVARGAGHDVRPNGAGVFPVFEARSFMVGTTATNEDEREEDETADGDDLQAYEKMEVRKRARATELEGMSLRRTHWIAKIQTRQKS